MLALKILVSVKQTLTIQLREVGGCSANLLRIIIWLLLMVEHDARGIINPLLRFNRV